VQRSGAEVSQFRQLNGAVGQDDLMERVRRPEVSQAELTRKLRDRAAELAATRQIIKLDHLREEIRQRDGEKERLTTEI
jgi:hypothetical protein